MRTKPLLFIFLFVTAVCLTASAQSPERKGWWKFDDPTNLLKATIGLPLELTGTEEATDGPDAGNGAVSIDLGSYLTMDHGILPSGDDTIVNEWSMQIDFLMPEGGIWHTFLQTSPNNSDDGELFINKTNNVGRWAIGYSENAVSENTWYRMVVTAKNGEFCRIFMNGELWLEFASSSSVDDIALNGRMALYPKILIFGDNDGDDGLILCSELSIWDVALDPEVVTGLGDATTIPTAIGKLSNTKKSALGQNFPNPFSTTTVLPYQLQEAGNVSFSIFDVTGKKIKEINEGMKSPGNYRLNISSEKMQNGIYFVQMKSNNHLFTNKITVNK